MPTLPVTASIAFTTAPCCLVDQTCTHSYIYIHKLRSNISTLGGDSPHTTVVQPLPLLLALCVSAGCVIPRHMKCSEAAQNGSLPMLQWSKEQAYDWDDYDVSVGAAQGGSTEILAW
jgi:hypothetical protein